MSTLRNDRRWGSGLISLFATLMVLMVSAQYVMAQAAPALEQQAEPKQSKSLRVSIKEAPPFTIKNEEGEWEGLAVELWRQIALDLGVEFTLHETTLPGVLQEVSAGRSDVGVAAMTITSEREKTVDFSQPYYVTGLGIAVPNTQQSGILHTLRQFVSWAFLQTVLALVALLLAAGLLVWFFERKDAGRQFGGKPREGLMSGFWWAAVTMTTVGYGDKAPATAGGRLVGLVWMFTSVIIISSFTAAIASSLTLNQLQGPVQGSDDLGKVRVGTLTDSTSHRYLQNHRLASVQYDTVTQALDAMVDGRIDAVVSDSPILAYQIKQQYQGRLRLLPGTFEEQYYGLVLGPDSPYREQINQSLLLHINENDWADRVKGYLGK